MAILYPEAYDRRSYLGLTDKSIKLVPAFQVEGCKAVSLLLEGAEITDLEIRLRNSHTSITIIDVLVASIRLSRKSDGKIFYYNTKASSVVDDITSIITEGMYDVISYEIIVLTTHARGELTLADSEGWANPSTLFLPVALTRDGKDYALSVFKTGITEADREIIEIPVRSGTSEDYMKTSGSFLQERINNEPWSTIGPQVPTIHDVYIRHFALNLEPNNIDLESVKDTVYKQVMDTIDDRYIAL